MSVHLAVRQVVDPFASATLLFCLFSVQFVLFLVLFSFWAVSLSLHVLMTTLLVCCVDEQFMMVCVSKGDLRSKYSKARFLSFLRTLCLKLREDPSLSWVFFEERPQGQTVRFSLRVRCGFLRHS